MLEIAKLFGSFLTGGLAGALITEWFRLRRNRVQRIPLIERVNRVVNPELQGITLARVIGTSTDRQLEEVMNLREYQLTIRNDSSVHLKDAEVQFEFPADDVEARAERPILSKTTLVPVSATLTEPWRKAFRWKIPYLLSGDSIEFTFRAVNPSSEKYEAVLYNSDGVIFGEKRIGEPPANKKTFNVVIAIVGAVSLAVILALVLNGRLRVQSLSGEKLTPIKLAGCDLRVVSFYDVYGQNLHSPWRIKHRIFNLGTHDCVIQSEKLNFASPVTVKPGEIVERESVSDTAPELTHAEILVGATGASLTTTSVPLYLEP